MEIKKVGVLGCGLMGSGIAQTAAGAGFETVVREVSDEFAAKKALWESKITGEICRERHNHREQQKATRDRLSAQLHSADLATATS